MKQLLYVVAAAVISAQGCAGPGTTKPVPSQPEARKDPQSTVEPRSEPGEGQKFLASMTGDWKVVKTFYPRGGGAPSVTPGTCTQTMIHGGRFLKSEFVFNDQGGDTTGTGMIGFDPQDGKFTSFWVDSRSTRISVRQSATPFDGHQIVLFSQSVGEPGPSARKSRTVTVLEDGGKQLIHRQYSDSPDAPPRLVMQLQMTRK